MKIKKLHIQGFKSFADATDLHFGAGITSVVGPNGCGKSNVVDAIKWVMGEQSAKLLRGQSMEDVIFGGSESRKAVGMAEVSITFENQGTAQPLGYEQYSEIEVTRRLYRSGESEYLLNKAPSRLRDVQELFMDTGVGARAYSIIEQGQIGALVNAKPEDRRFLIEEAAGITKFKKRKDEAIRKMEATEQNLLRIGDRAQELKRQLNGLDRQARKAEKYKELQAAGRGIELGILYERHTAIAGELAAAQERLTRLTEDETRLAAAFGEQEIEAQTLKLQIAELEKEVVALRNEAFAAAERVSNHEKDLEINRNRLELSISQIKSLSLELENSDRRRSDLEAEIVATEGAVETFAVALAECEENVRAREGELAEKQRLVIELAGAYEAANQSVMELLQRLTEKKAATENARTRRDELIRRLEDTQFEAGERREILGEAAARAADLTARHAAAEAEKAELAERREKLAKELDELREELKVSVPRLETERRGIQERESRLQSLRELEAAHEGLREGVKELLDQARTNPELGIEGVVADAVEPTAGLEAPLAAYLGERLEALLVSDVDKALKAVAVLKAGEGRGRATFLPADTRLNAGEPVSGQRLADLLHFKGSRGMQVKKLLEQVLLAETDEAAMQVWKENPGFAVVSREGFVVFADGTLAGGGEERGTAMLRQKREAIELDEEIRKRKSAVRTLEEDVQEARNREAFIVEESDAARGEMHQLELQLTEIQRDLAAATKDRDRLTRELEDLDEEATNFQSDMDTILEQVGAGERELLLINQQREESIARREDNTRRHQEARVALDAVGQVISDLRVELADSRSALQNKRELHVRLSREREAMDERGRRADLELAESEKRKVEFERLIAEAAGGTDSLVKKKMELEATTIAAVDRLNAIKDDLNKREMGGRDARRDHDQVRQEVSQQSLKLAELQKDIAFIIEQFEEKFKVTLESIAPADMDLEGESEDRRLKLADLKRKMEAMGEINLAAINEYKEIEQRYGFIETQQKDLHDSLEALRKAINKIQKTSRERFQATFDIVNEKFKMVFPRLFNGGHAELKLTEDSDGDLLDAGVEIIAQPPGKKLGRVNLLSGGEKALTAVSLIFAIFLLKPSPFCILDEVDAPLDDANIDRFNALLEEMNRLTQILMITHNKHTMEIADEMYGVTMAESGVSRVVNVQLT
jgi:chromosome segregation protein